MSTLDTPVLGPGPVDHSRCDFGGTRVRCDRCGRAFVCTPSDDLNCTDDGDHCCEGCLLAGYPQPLITVDPTTDASPLGHGDGSASAPQGDR
jgi:hypothetical protein